MHRNAVSGNEIKEFTEVYPLKVYKQRWLILALFCLYAIANRIQYIVYSVISDIIEDYYGVSSTAVQWTALIKIVEVLIFNIPGAYALDKLGLRWSVIIGLIGTCVGSWIKIASVDSSRFWVLLLGQGVTGLFQVLVMPLPGKIAATWFPKDQVSLACSLGIIGILLDQVFGFLIPPLLVQRGSVQQVEEGLYKLAYLFAIYPTVLLPIILIFFKNSPPTPPSLAETHAEDTDNKKNFKESLKIVLSNRSFVIFLIIFSICNGTAIPILIKANELILKYYPDAAKDIGYIGAICVTCGIVSTIVFGILLDKCKQFKLITTTIFTLYALFVIIFFGTLSINLVLVYFTAAIVGFLGMGLMTIAFNVSIELTYPEPTGTSGALLIALSQVAALIFTHLYTEIFKLNQVVSTSVIAGILIITVSLFMFVKFDMKRQAFERLHEDIERRY